MLCKTDAKYGATLRLRFTLRSSMKRVQAMVTLPAARDARICPGIMQFLWIGAYSLASLAFRLTAATSPREANKAKSPARKNRPKGIRLVAESDRPRTSRCNR